jgi:hypothetical protein
MITYGISAGWSWRPLAKGIPTGSQIRFSFIRFFPRAASIAAVAGATAADCPLFVALLLMIVCGGGFCNLLMTRKKRMREWHMDFGLKGIFVPFLGMDAFRRGIRLQIHPAAGDAGAVLMDHKFAQIHS